MSGAGAPGNGEGTNRGEGSERSLPGTPEPFVHVDPGTSHEHRHVAAAAEPGGGGGGATPRQEYPDAAYVRDLRSAFSSVPRPKPRWQDRFMKLLIVGETGQGKTTFIKNMFASYAQDPDLRVNDVSAPTSKEEFEEAPEKLCTEIVVTDAAAQTRFHYRVQDTPGYDSMEVNMDPILRYIDACNEAALAREQDAARALPLSQDDDPRVDVVIYFLSPHRVKPIDLRLMAELAARAPVVPVLAKADSMTTAELRHFRDAVRAALERASKDAKRQVAYQFSEEALREAGVGPGVPPFAVVASIVMDPAIGRFWPVRRYPWGTCEALSSVHSDLSALKKLLFEVAFEELKQATEARYYRFRQATLFNLDDPNRPVHRLTLAEQLHRTLRASRRRPRGLRSLLRGAARFALSGVVCYAAVAALRSRRVRGRLQQAGQQAKETLERTAETVEAKAVEGKTAVEEKLGLGDGGRAAREEEARRKRRGGLFGLFGGGR